MTQGYFEVSSFHGVPVALFDSHWFAHKIMKSRGKHCMCYEILDKVRILSGSESIFGIYWLDTYAAMMPYRDFMAVHRNKTRNRPQQSLTSLFRISGSQEFWYMEEFRKATAKKMLSSPPIRYCIPLRIFHDVS